MKILWIKANKILPVHSGGDIRSYNIARQLMTEHELTFFSYHDGSADPGYERELQKHFPGAVCVCTSKSEGRIARAADYLRRLPQGGAYAVSRFESSRVKGELRGCFRKKQFDVAICDFLDATINFPSDVDVPSVLFQHNVESEIWRRHAQTESNPVKRSIYGREFRKMLAYEQAAVRKAQHVIAVSEHDRQLMSAWVDGTRITVVPTGVDLSQYRPDSSAPEPGPVVMFVGAMDWEPNVDAMQFFCSDVWPVIVKAHPAAKLRIVGRNPDRQITKFAGDSIEITGRVPSVVEHLRQAAVVVVPLRIGGGTRLKIYEAMATGKAVVSTRVGAEGLDVNPGQDIVFADSAHELTDAVLAFLRDASLRRRFERAAAETAARYDWSAIGSQFGHLLESVVRTPVLSGRSA